MRQAATALQLDRGRTSSWLPSAPPLHLTSFIGRDRELHQVQNLLGTHRLVTLTGAGGSGKTRLAAEVVRRLAWHEGQEWTWVELATTSDPAMVPQQVTAALGFQEVIGNGPNMTLADIVRDQAALLVLDNCEHLVDACATLTEQVLRACPLVRILVTSREALGVPGERSLVVPPLSIPEDTGGVSPSSIAITESVELFVDRARATSPAFDLSEENSAAIAHICRRLDGLPLAIELAAARIKVLGPEQIADRLDDSFHLLTSSGRTTSPRHRTLWAAIDWSYALLTEREQSLLRRLSVFSGGFTLDAVHNICGDVPEHDVLDVLTALVDKSLVVAEVSGNQARYGLLETVREFAQEQLRAAGDESIVREQYADYFLNFVWANEKTMFGGASDPSLTARIEAERANLRGVADWCERRPERTDAALRLATALHWFWFAKGRFREARTRLTTALGLEGTVDSLVRARALAAQGHVAIWLGDDHAALTSLEESVTQLRVADDRQWMSYALAGLGAAHVRQGRSSKARIILDEAVAIARMVDTKVLLPFALYWQGICAEVEGNAARAKRAFQEATSVARERGHKPSIGHTFYALGRLAHREGDPAGALAHLTESLAALHETDDRWGTVNVLDELARLASADGKPDRVVMFLAFAEMLREEMGVAVPTAIRGEQAELIASTRESMSDGEFAERWSAGRSLSLDELLALLRAWPTANRPGYTLGTGATGPSQVVLQVLALGPLEVIRNGKLLGPEVWRSAKARELLVFLLCHPRGCTRDQIGLAFWPDASSAQVRDNVNVTLHRLRRALGSSESIALVDERYVLGKGQTCEFDVTIFEHEITAGQRELRTGADAERLRSALKLYRGDFMEGESVADWHMEHCDRLRRLFLNALVALGDWQHTHHAYAEAIETYQRIIALDPLHEGAYRGLMQCHVGLGERTTALRLYNRLTESLQKELGCGPDHATATLYASLRAATAEQHAEP